MTVGTELPARLPSLTGLRFVAAGLVVLYHASKVLAPGTELMRFSTLGYVGVTFFFVLSGFVLTWSAEPEGFDTRAFYRRRFARVYPMHALTWGAAVVVLPLLGFATSAVGSVLALVLLQAWVPSASVFYAANSPSWTLACEAFFYAVFPFLLRRLRPSTSALLGAVAVMCVGGVVLDLALGRHHGWALEIEPLWRSGQFVCGILLALVLKQGKRPPVPLWVAGAAAVGLYLVLSLTWLDGPANALLLPLLCLVIACGAAGDIDGRASVWSTRPAVVLGEWSFALYLVHWLGTKALEGHPGLIGHGPLVAWLLTFGYLLVATAVAGLAYTVVERPLERRLRGRTGRPRDLILSGALPTEP